MASIGNKLCWIAPFAATQTPGAAPAYTAASAIHPAINGTNYAVSNASGDVEGDDTVSTIDEYVSSKLTLTFRELDPNDEAMYLGSTVDGTTQEVSDRSADLVPFVGIVCATLKVDATGARYYECAWYPKCRAVPTGNSSKSKGKSISPVYPTGEFSVYEDDLGNHRVRVKKTTASLAETWCKSKLGIT